MATSAEIQAQINERIEANKQFDTLFPDANAKANREAMLQQLKYQLAQAQASEGQANATPAAPATAAAPDKNVKPEDQKASAPGATVAALPTQPVDNATAQALVNTTGSIQQALPVAQNLVQNGTLGRIDATQISASPSVNMQDVIARRQAALGGMSAQEQQVQTEAGNQAVNKATQTATRQLQASQNQSGVRGGTASAQQLQSIMAGIQAKSNVQRDVYLQNQQNKRDALTAYEGSVTSADAATYQKQLAAVNLQQFNLAQSAKEQYAQLSLGMGIAGIAGGNVASDKAISAQQQAAAAGGSSGNSATIICTELHRQGIMSDAIYEADQKFGDSLPLFVLDGYQCWARHVVKLMQKSAKFTNVVAFIAMPWARSMAGEFNFLGDVVMLIGLPICAIIGKIRQFFRRAASCL